MHLIRNIFVFWLLFFSNNGYTQNLFANPGFEDINICVEYHANCAPEAWFNIPAAIYPVNGRFAQRPVLGHMFLVLPVGSVLPAFNDKRRFAYSRLICPLVKGEKYNLSFYITAAGKTFERLDFYFTDKEPTLDNFNVLNKTPTFSITEQHIDAVYKTVWHHVKYEFTATTNSQFCVIGNFSPLRHVYEMKDAMSTAGDIFYFIDEIFLKHLGDNNLCPGYIDNIKKMYAQDYRHTDNITLAKDTPVTRGKPRLITDTVTIPTVLFDVNSAVIKPAIIKILDSVINKINDTKIAKVEINGHTDNTGTVAWNEILALSRAKSVRKYLLQKLPQLSGKLFISGKGEHSPIADNETETGRQKNRRVEIVLTFTNTQK